MLKKPIISVTQNAMKQFNNILNETKYNYFTLGLKSGGCSGFEYNLKPVKNTDKALKNVEIFKKDNIEIHICNKSVMYLLGTEIDWEENIISKKFIFKNPLAEIKCGCGTSFSPYK